MGHLMIVPEGQRPSLYFSSSAVYLLSIAFLCLPLLSLAVEWQETRLRMGSPLTVRLYGSDEKSLKELSERIFHEVLRLEFLLSHFIPESEISQINRRAGSDWFAVSKETLECLGQALYYARKTEGVFDPTVGGRPIGYHEVEIKDDRVRLRRPGMALDLGGIGKGYVLDKALELLYDRNVSGCVLNFGGQLLFWKREGFVLPPWEVFIKRPYGQKTRLLLEKGSVSTSSYRYQKNHVVDPKKGQPVREGVYSVVVVASSATAADALSTAFFVLGPFKTEQLFTASNAFFNVKVIFITHGGRTIEYETPSMTKKI